MKKVFDKIEQRGTLLIEAIAMLGLIAMVTPTLYKKSAERLQEIQDINAASQARIFNSVIKTFIKTNFSGLREATSSNTTIEIAYDDNAGVDYFDNGYSSFLPFGYTMDTIKNYEKPRVFVHRDNSTFISYIFYPHIVDPGHKRAARLASLVGANGGMVTNLAQVQGTAGAWALDDELLEELGIEAISGNLNPLKANNLVVTSEEPIQDSTEDNDNYLYRVEPKGPQDVYHNTMVTNLYMGGHSGKENIKKASADQFWGIYNTRKLTLNTDCNYEALKGQATSPEDTPTSCDPNVADLYIGKPFGNFASDAQSPVAPNTGAAWIYGNLSAIKKGFDVTRDSSSGSVEMIFRSVGTDEPEDISDDNNLLRAVYDAGTTSSAVEMIGKFVRATKEDGSYQYVIGSSSAENLSGEDVLFAASVTGGQHSVHIGTKQDAAVYMAEKGGFVYINAGSSVADSSAVTIINNGGGSLFMGASDGGWLHAGGEGADAFVHILKDEGRDFRVGKEDENEAMILANFGSSAADTKVSVLGKRFRATGDNFYDESSKSGGVAASGLAALDGFTAITTKYNDIFGSTYLGSEEMQAPEADNGVYTRGVYTLGVAGSAWVDQFLWARNAWFNSTGMKDFHAGFENMNKYATSPKTGWINVYGPGGDAEGGRVVIRDPNKVADPLSMGDANDVMFLASSNVAVVSDAAGAWLELHHGVAKMGTEHNYFYADSSNSGNVSGSSKVIGADAVLIHTKDDVASKVDLQNGAFELYGHGSSIAHGLYSNEIRAKAGVFTLATSSGVTNDSDDVQFYADGSKIRTRYVDFEVQNSGSSVVFGVHPNLEPDATTGPANVEINGSLHVSGNKVVHIASNAEHEVDESSHAMFEIDPNYVRVWARDEVNNRYGDGGEEYYAMLTINPKDVDGSSLAVTNPGLMDDTSIYVRRGAIELMKSQYSDVDSSTYGADEGFGYIRANRLVSNAGMPVPDISAATTGANGDRVTADSAYDQFMVNPAYTSVMHDIKLTSRGNARLSDILPDFVLKGVYNVSNDFTETGDGDDERIQWSAGDACSKIGCKNVDVAWASPFLGMIPYGMCPPGYKNMATVVPISFQLGRAGRLVEAAPYGGVDTKAKWKLAEPTSQANILSKASGMSGGLMYPEFEEVKSFVLNDIFQSSDTFSSFIATASSVTEGWYWGMKQGYNAVGSSTGGFSRDSSQVGSYRDAEDTEFAVADPLYFQEGTFLKTSLTPTTDKGWEARMGFIYDETHWANMTKSAPFSGNIVSNNTDTNSSAVGMFNRYVWNLFPVPTNTLEGHATVYCYFDRKQFEGSPEVLQFDAFDDAYNPFNKTNSGGAASNSEEYIKRLNDPTLKYNDPW